MILGDILQTLPAMREAIGGPAALVHNDISCGDPNESRQIAEALPRVLSPLLASRAVIVSDQNLWSPGWVRHPLPAAVPPDRYFMWRLQMSHNATER